MRCCGTNCDYLRARWEACDNDGTDFQVAYDLLYQQDEVNTIKQKEDRTEESGES